MARLGQQYFDQLGGVFTQGIDLILSQLGKPTLKTLFKAAIVESVVLFKRECSQGRELTTHNLLRPLGL